jgi:hypothetical protein
VLEDIKKRGKKLARIVKERVWKERKDWKLFIYINVQVRNPYEHGNDARRNKEKEGK